MIRMMTTLFAALAATATGAAHAQAPAPKPAKDWQVPDRPEIRRILVQRIDEQHQARGIVVGLVDASGRRVVSYGVRDQGDNRPLDGRSMFELGSMTKVFTSLILADMAEHREVRLDDPVAKYLPAASKVPERGGKQITLIDLATHTSGLPRLAANMSPKDLANPYADYTDQQLLQFLAGYQLPRDIGAQYEYSNLGGGLLGHVLALSAKTDYGTLVRRRITGPLGMASTTIALTRGQKARLAAGHNPALEPAANWDIPTLAGAGALRSDADDMLTFLAAELGYVKSPLAAAMRAQLVPRRPTPMPGAEVALGWHVSAVPGGPVVWHNGGTGGYRTIMAFDPKARVGVVVLADTETLAGVDDIAFHILAGTPLAQPPGPPKPPVLRHEIPVDAEVMRGLAGHYQLTPQLIAEVTVQDGQMFIQLTGQGKAPVYFEGPNRVFWKVVDAQANFETDADGHGVAMVLHQSGQTLRAPRLKDELEPGR